MNTSGFGPSLFKLSITIVFFIVTNNCLFHGQQQLSYSLSVTELSFYIVTNNCLVHGQKQFYEKLNTIKAWTEKYYYRSYTVITHKPNQQQHRSPNTQKQFTALSSIYNNRYLTHIYPFGS